MPLPSGSDYDLDSGLAGGVFRGELNTILAALLSMNSSASLPPITEAFMLRANLATTPNQVEIRSSDDSTFLKLAEVTASAVTLFSQGAAVPSLGAAQTFTQPQTVDVSGSAGSMTVASDLSSGVVARIPMIGHNASSANVTGVNLVCRIETSTAGAEDFQFDVEVVRGGSTVRVARLGSLSDFTRSGSGTLNADILQQAGIALSQIVREAKGRFENGGDFNTDINSFVQSDEGAMFRFNGTSNVTVKLNKLARGTVIFFQNESSNQSTVTFAAADSDPVLDFRTPRLTLPGISTQAPFCAVHWYLSDGRRVNIFGDNV